MVFFPVSAMALTARSVSSDTAPLSIRAPQERCLAEAEGSSSGNTPSRDARETDSIQRSGRHDRSFCAEIMWHRRFGSQLKQLNNVIACAFQVRAHCLRLGRAGEI